MLSNGPIETGNVSCYEIKTDLVGAASVNGVVVLSLLKPPSHSILNYAYTNSMIDISFLSSYEEDNVSTSKGGLAKLDSDQIIQSSLMVELTTRTVDWIGGSDPELAEEGVIENYIIDVYDLIKQSDIFSGLKNQELEDAINNFLDERLFHFTVYHEYDKEGGGFLTQPQQATVVVRKNNNFFKNIIIPNVMQRDTYLHIALPKIKKIEQLSVMSKLINSKFEQEISINFPFEYQKTEIILYAINVNLEEGSTELSLVYGENFESYLLVDNEKLDQIIIKEEDAASEEDSLISEALLNILSYNVEDLFPNIIDTNKEYALQIKHYYVFEEENGSDSQPFYTPIEKEHTVESDLYFFDWTISQEYANPEFIFAKQYPPEKMLDNKEEFLLIYTSVPKKEIKLYVGSNIEKGFFPDEEIDVSTLASNVFSYTKTFIQMSSLNEDAFELELDMELNMQEEIKNVTIIAKEENADDKKYYLVLVKGLPDNIFDVSIRFEYENEGVVYSTDAVRCLVVRDGKDAAKDEQFAIEVKPSHRGFAATVTVPAEVYGRTWQEELDPEKPLNQVNGLENFVVEYKDIAGNWQALEKTKSEEALLTFYIENPILTLEELADTSIPHQLRLKYYYQPTFEKQGISSSFFPKESDWIYSKEWYYQPTVYNAPYNFFLYSYNEEEKHILGFDRDYLFDEAGSESSLSTIQEGLVIKNYKLQYKKPEEAGYQEYIIAGDETEARVGLNNNSKTIELDILYTDLQIDSFTSYIFRLMTIYTDTNKVIDEVYSLPYTVSRIGVGQNKNSLTLTGLTLHETNTAYVITFNRNFSWSNEIGLQSTTTEGQSSSAIILPDTYTFNSYKLRYKKAEEENWQELEFDNQQLMTKTTNSSGFVRVEREFLKSDNLFALDFNAYMFELSMSYNVPKPLSGGDLSTGEGTQNPSSNSPNTNLEYTNPIRYLYKNIISTTTIKPYEFIFNETTEKYKLSFYRNFLWSGENGQTEGTLSDNYAFVNYRLRYKKDIDSAWSEYLFDDVADTVLDYADPEGIVRVSHEITKSDTAPIQLEEASYVMELQIIYNITEGDPPVTTEYVSEPSRYFLNNVASGFRIPLIYSVADNGLELFLDLTAVPEGFTAGTQTLEVYNGDSFVPFQESPFTIDALSFTETDVNSIFNRGEEYWFRIKLEYTRDSDGEVLETDWQDFKSFVGKQRHGIENFYAANRELGVKLYWDEVKTLDQTTYQSTSIEIYDEETEDWIEFGNYNISPQNININFDDYIKGKEHFFRARHNKTYQSSDVPTEWAYSSSALGRSGLALSYIITSNGVYSHPVEGEYTFVRGSFTGNGQMTVSTQYSSATNTTKITLNVSNIGTRTTSSNVSPFASSESGVLFLGAELRFE